MRVVERQPSLLVSPKWDLQGGQGQQQLLEALHFGIAGDSDGVWQVR